MSMRNWTAVEGEKEAGETETVRPGRRANTGKKAKFFRINP